MTVMGFMPGKREGKVMLKTFLSRMSVPWALRLGKNPATASRTDAEAPASLAFSAMYMGFCWRASRMLSSRVRTIFPSGAGLSWAAAAAENPTRRVRASRARRVGFISFSLRR